ncbi:MAG: HEAT repeat domain-containing protein [Gemmatimonadota bacterium]|jgi:methylated-DNA-[protein]-cysteine S-methyltransferase
MPVKPLKTVLREHLVQGNLEEIADLAMERRKVLGTLLGLTFDADVEVVWRAIEAQGMAAERLSGESPSYVREHMRRLYWLITEESGACFWRAPECMAECGARLPRLLQSHVPIAFHLLETLEEEDLEHFRPGALWAVGRLFHLAEEHLPGILPLVLDALSDPLAQSRGMAVWCLREIGKGAALSEYPALLEDQAVVHIYRNRSVDETTVAALAQEVLEEAEASAGAG